MYHATANHYGDMLAKIRKEILGQITAALELLKGKVCLGYYHNNWDFDRYTFFELDEYGYGKELYIDTVEAKEGGEIEIHLSDSEDCYSPVWDSSDLTATDAMSLLVELENVIEHTEKTGEAPVSEYVEDE